MTSRWLKPAALLAASCFLSPVARAQSDATDTVVATAKRLLAARAAADSFSGAVLIAFNGKPLLREGYGLADRERRVANQTTTKFNLASIDKLITRIAIWQLVADNKLSLDEPIGRYLPDYPNKDVRERVTARQLINMSSGVGNWYNDEYRRRHRDIKSVDDYLALFAADPLQFEPGSSRAYSNGGYVVLGKIIEKLSGQSYYDYVRDRITGPAGMSDTRHYLIDERVPNRAVGYTSQDSSDQGPGNGSSASHGRQPNSWSLAGRGSPAGGGYSTVDDFLKLDGALRGGRLLPAAFADSLLPSAFRSGGATPIRYAGGGPGANTEYLGFSDGYTIIVFSNYDPPTATNVVQELAKALGKALPAGGPTLRMRPPG
jgi:CubicO group peptidase (beta-lactamase class C family)